MRQQCGFCIDSEGAEALMRVLHLVSEMTWRGGENQLRLLLEHTQPGICQWFVAAPPGSAGSERLASFATLYELPLRSWQGLSALPSLLTIIDREGIQLVDCQSSRAHNIGLAMKYLRPELKLVVHRRVDYPPGSSWFNRRKYLSSRVDRYICISAAIAALLRAYGIEEKKLRLVPSAVDARPFQSVDRLAARQKFYADMGLPSEVPVIGNVAYLTEQKDHATLLRALAILRQRKLDFFCFIAGAGALEAELKTLAQNLDLGPRHIRFLGVRTDIPELLAAASIFALSSRDEGLGTSLLDAVHSGCTLVATAVGGIPEIVIPEQTGLLAPAGDAETFAAQLERLLGDTALRQSLGAAASQHVNTHFSLSNMVEGNLAVYRELLGQSPPR